MCVSLFFLDDNQRIATPPVGGPDPAYFMNAKGISLLADARASAKME